MFSLLVKRSPSAPVPHLPAGWVAFSSPNPRSLPFPLLEPSERRFLQVVTSRALLNKDELLFLLHDCFGVLLSSLSDDSLGRNLFVGECYADREYYAPSSDRAFLGSVRVFRLGLVCAVPMPATGTRLKYWYCYWRDTPYRLLPQNFVRPFPPHDAFASWCFSSLRAGLLEAEFSLSPPSFRKLPFWDGSGAYIADNCYVINKNGHKEHLWVEIHTGSEGYDEKIFIPRLLSAERELRGKGRYLVIVPFKRDLATAQRAIKKYNLQAESDGKKPSLELSLSEIVCYHELPSFREKLGFYRHATRV